MPYDLNFGLHSRHQGTVKKYSSCERIINYFWVLYKWTALCIYHFDQMDAVDGGIHRICLNEYCYRSELRTNDTICAVQGKREQQEGQKPDGNSVAVFHQQILLLDTKSRLHLPVALITWIILIFHPDTHSHFLLFIVMSSWNGGWLFVSRSSINI